MSTYEQLVINGVPFLHSNGKLYYYELTPSEPVEIGTLVNGALQLSAGWAERIQPRVDAWRGTVAPSERGKTVRAPKQSKPKRSPKSAATVARGAGEAAGVVAATGVSVAKATATATTTATSEAAPEPRPKRILRRRAAPGASP
jgi:hypothetical protein